MSLEKALTTLYKNKYINKNYLGTGVVKVLDIEIIATGIFIAVYFNCIDLLGKKYSRHMTLSNDVKPDRWFELITSDIKIVPCPKIATTDIYKSLTEGE